MIWLLNTVDLLRAQHEAALQREYEALVFVTLACCVPSLIAIVIIALTCGNTSGTRRL